MLMKLIHKRHYTSHLSVNLRAFERTQSSEQSQILSLCKSGSFSEALQLLNSTDPTQISAKPLLYASLLQTSTKLQSFRHGLQLHSHLIKFGLEADRFVGNSLLNLYFKLSPNFNEARKVFDGLFVKDVIAWTSMVTGYVQVRKPMKGLEFFADMLDCGMEANAFTLSAVVKACSELQDMKLGKCFHGVVFRRGFCPNCVIASALIDMYGRNGGTMDARRVFDELLEPDAICWTSIVSALTRNDFSKEALEIFDMMLRRSEFVPDEFTYGSVMTACGNSGKSKLGRELHAKVITAGLLGNVVVESSLVDMYAKCGKVEISLRIFDRMHKKNAISWCALLGGYCHSGDFESVIKLFRNMEQHDLYSFGTVLRACAGLAAIKHGKEVHCQYLRKVGWRHVIIESALVDLYAKCGCIGYGEAIFSEMPVKNLITWNSMICGFAQNGKGHEAIAIYNRMVKEGIKPDYISFVGVLFACSHAGLVDEGQRFFTLMTEVYMIKPGTEHVNCMVDLLGRAGLTEEAEMLIEKVDCKDVSLLWPALLGSCTTSRNFTAAERVAKKMIQLEPDNHLSYVHLANVYKHFGHWSSALKIRKLMDEKGIKKMPGRSWVESKKGFGVFGFKSLNRDCRFPSITSVVG